MSYERIKRIPIIHSNICYLGAKQSNSKQSSVAISETFSGIRDEEALSKISDLIAGDGVTDDLTRQRAERLRVANLAGEDTTQFSTENAFALSKDAVAGLVRQLNEKNLPTIDRAEEAGGTSGSSFAVLAKNDLAARTAEQGASLGVKLASLFAEQSTKSRQTQASLSTIDNSSIDALLKAIGATQVSEGSSSSVSKGKSSSSEGSFFGG